MRRDSEVQRLTAHPEYLLDTRQARTVLKRMWSAEGI
jgi:homoserine kinase